MRESNRIFKVDTAAKDVDDLIFGDAGDAIVSER